MCASAVALRYHKWMDLFVSSGEGLLTPLFPVISEFVCVELLVFYSDRNVLFPLIPSFSRASDQTDPVTHTDARHYTITAIFLFPVAKTFAWPFLKFQVGLQLLIILVIRCLAILIIVMIDGALWRHGKNGIHGRVPRWKPLLTKTEHKSPSNICHLDNPRDYWGNILWTDEAKVELLVCIPPHLV